MFVDFKVTAKGKHVFAAKDYNQGSLKLVPYSQNLINALKKEKECMGPHLIMKLVRKETFRCTFHPAAAPKQDNKSSMPFPGAFIIPYWLVRRTEERKLANMQYTNSEISMTMTANSEDSISKAEIPIWQNNKAIKAGDELLVFEERMQEKRPATLEPLPQPSTKQQRR